MAWNYKKIKAKMNDFFKSKNINYSLEEDKGLKFKFEVCLNEAGFMLYPYLTFSDNIVSFNANVIEVSNKLVDYSKMNDFNMKSKMFKCFYTEDQIIVIEYKFLLNDEFIDILELLVDQIFLLQFEIDKL
jgi:hypothetical protein